MTATRILVERVSAVENDVPRLKQRRNLPDRPVHGIACSDHQEDTARLLERTDELLQIVERMKVRGRVALCSVLRHIRRTVPPRHLKAVIRHVEREIAPHDPHADHSDVHCSVLHPDLPPSTPCLICRDLGKFFL